MPADHALTSTSPRSDASPDTTADHTLVHEIVVVVAAAGVAATEMTAALHAVEPWLIAQPGFVARALMHDAGTGVWVDHVRWRDAASAHAAAERLPSTPAGAALMALLDVGATRMFHARRV